MQSMKATVAPVVLGALSAMISKLGEWLQQIPGMTSEIFVQKSTVLGTPGLQDKYSLFLCRCCKACDYRSLRQCCITMPWLLLMYCFNQGADLFTETLIIGNNLQITNRSVL